MYWGDWGSILRKLNFLFALCNLQNLNSNDFFIQCIHSLLQANTKLSEHTFTVCLSLWHMSSFSKLKKIISGKMNFQDKIVYSIHFDWKVTLCYDFRKNKLQKNVMDGYTTPFYRELNLSRCKLIWSPILKDLKVSYKKISWPKPFGFINFHEKEPSRMIQNDYERSETFQDRAFDWSQSMNILVVLWRRSSPLIIKDKPSRMFQDQTQTF